MIDLKANKTDYLLASLVKNELTKLEIIMMRGMMAR